MPAFSTSMSTGRSPQRWTRASTDANDAVSRTSGSPPTAPAASAARSGVREVMTTDAPAAARARAVSRPMPLEPPVTSAVRPVRSGRGNGASREVTAKR